MSSCTSPRKRWVLYKDGSPCRFHPRSGKPIGVVTSYEVEFVEAPFGYEYVSQVIPCGQCIQCRLKHASEWADRCMLELPYHENNWFVTFTYDDDHLPYTYGYLDFDSGEVSLCGTLFYDDLQRFFKNLRIYLERHGLMEENKMSYIACGEYGPQTLRPHYHACIFGLPLFDVVPVSKSSQGFQYYSSPFLQKFWPYGRVMIGEVTWETCAYVARYTTKKLGSRPDYRDIPKELLDRYRIKNPYFYLGIEAEKPRYSLKPAIGKRYYEEHGNRIYETDKIYLAGKKPKVIKPPAYYDKLYDVDDHVDMERIKALRKYAAEESHKLVMEKTDLTEAEYLADRERDSERILDALPRSGIDAGVTIGVPQYDRNYLKSTGKRIVTGRLKSKTVFDEE